jgi:hypothetical protein
MQLDFSDQLEILVSLAANIYYREYNRDWLDVHVEL